jgi:hypothetical protein
MENWKHGNTKIESQHHKTTTDRFKSLFQEKSVEKGSQSRIDKKAAAHFLLTSGDHEAEKNLNSDFASPASGRHARGSIVYATNSTFSHTNICLHFLIAVNYAALPRSGQYSSYIGGVANFPFVSDPPVASSECDPT